MEEQTLYRFWSAALPRNVKAVLALQPVDTPLTRLAEMADQVYECCGSPVVQQVSKSAVEETPDLLIYGDYAKQLVRCLEALELANKANNRRWSISRSRRQRSKSGTHKRSATITGVSEMMPANVSSHAPTKIARMRRETF